jgi:predicted nucleic acid-binding protein
MVAKRSLRRDPDPSVRGVAADLEDDLVLGTAIAANADFLVTGDKAMLALEEHQGVRIVTAERFLADAGLE